MSHAFRTAGMLAAALWVFMVLAIGEAAACQKGDKASYHDKIVAAVESAPAAQMILIANASPSRSIDQVNGFNCHGCGHCGGIACSSGSCSACAPALLALGPLPILDDLADVYILPLEAAFAHLKPPPDFRPPRTFA